jgi:ATP-dependent DNA helicase RecG
MIRPVTPDEIRARLRTGEDSRTEFKSVESGLPTADDVTKELTAFANSGGGDLLFGVGDDATVSGVGTPKDAERLQRHVAQSCRDSVEPPLSVRQLVVEVDDQLVVVARVAGYLPGRPFRGRSRYFVRDGPISREASSSELKRLLASAADVHYDEQSIEEATRDDLDPGLVSDLVKRMSLRSSGDELHYLRAVKAVDASGTPTVAGLLALGREPQSFLVDAYVSAVRFAGTEIATDVRDRKDIRGPLPTQIEDAVAFLTRHTPTPLKIEGARRAPGIGPEVWREAVTNAVAHRDYNITSQVRIYVFTDRVEIVNPGGLLNQMTVDSIRLGGVSQRRNPYLAAILNRLGFAETVGLGVPQMFRAVMDAGLPEPEIQAALGEFRLTIVTETTGD